MAVESAPSKPKSSVSSPVALKPGTRLGGRYELLDLLGSGGTCRVFKARDLYLAKAGEKASEIAVKVLKERLLRDEDAVRMLQQEVYKSRRLAHPNVVRLYDCDWTQGHFLVTMELLEGEPLSEVIRRARPRGLPVSGALEIVRSAASALGAAHAQGMIHADLKPGNIILTHEGQVKLLDFGVARPIRRPQLPGLEGKGDDSDVLGLTPAYASCALLEGEPPTAADDIFSLACMAYELITSRHPFSRKPAAEARDAGLKPKRCAGLKGYQWRALKKGLSFHNRDNYAEVEHFVHALTRRPSRPVWGWLLFMVLIGGAAAWGYRHDLHETRVLQHLRAHQSKLDQLAQTLGQDHGSGGKLVSTAQLQRLHGWEKAAMIRLQRPQYLARLQKQVADGLAHPSGRQVDFVGLNSRLDQALKLYPDSGQILSLQQDLAQRRSSLLSALAFKANSLLEQRRYGHQGQGEDLYALYRDMQSVKPGYQLQPSAAAIKTYRKAVAAATSDWNPVAISGVLAVGRRFFKDQPSYTRLVSLGDGLAKSAETLAHYEAGDKQSRGPWPEKAAQAFYGSYLAKLKEQLVREKDDIHALYNLQGKLDRAAKHVPAQFPLLLQLRRALANHYINDANNLLNHGHYRAGKALIARANSMLSAMNQ